MMAVMEAIIGAIEARRKNGCPLVCLPKWLGLMRELHTFPTYAT
jgi:hypothetical protein